MNIADGFNFWVGHTFIPAMIGIAALFTVYFVIWKLTGGRVFKRKPKRRANTNVERITPAETTAITNEQELPPLNGEQG